MSPKAPKTLALALALALTLTLTITLAERIEPSRDSNVLILALDATRERIEHELCLMINGIRTRGDILRGGDSLLVFGVLHTVTNPMGYPMKACTDSFVGTSSRLLEEEVLKKGDMCGSMLLQIAEKCKEEGSCVFLKRT